MLDIFALVILAILLVTVVLAIWFLAGLPGRIALSRNHPQAESVKVAGWCSILLPIPLWPLAMIWAYWQADATASASEESAA